MSIKELYCLKKGDILDFHIGIKGAPVHRCFFNGIKSLNGEAYIELENSNKISSCECWYLTLVSKAKQKPRRILKDIYNENE